MMIKRTHLQIVLSLFFVFLIGCSEKETTTAEFGRIQMQLTDAPFPHDLIAEANVTIFKVEARQKDADTEEMDNSETDMDNEDDSTYIVLMEEEIDVNLLELTNGVTTMLLDTEIPVGSYDLFRVYVKGINVVMDDEASTTYDLKVPSGAQSGIKIFIDPPLAIAGGLSADVLLDFDVSRSFVPKGNIRNSETFNGFNFKPVIKVSNLTTAGTLYGEVSTADGLVEGVEITVSQEGEVVTTSSTDETGGYTIMGLESGFYEVSAALEGFETVTVEDVKIDVGNNTNLNFELVPLP